MAAVRFEGEFDQNQGSLRPSSAPQSLGGQRLLRLLLIVRATLSKQVLNGPLVGAELCVHSLLT